MEESNLKVLEQKNDVKETIDHFLTQADQFECVMLLAITKTGQQYLRSSTMSRYERCYLSNFCQAYVMSGFINEIGEI